MTQQGIQERFRFSSAALEGHSCKVVRFSGTEGLNTLYTFEIIIATQSFIDTRPFMVSPCTLTIGRAKDSSVHFHGYPTSCAQGAHINGWTFYTIRMEPQFSKLRGLVHNAIYLNKSVQEIVEEAFKHCGPIKPAHSFNLLQSYPKHEFTMQYNEDVYSYMAYFLEREGIYYYFDQQEGHEKVVFADAPMHHVPIEGESTLTYSPTSGLESIHVDEVVVSFSRVQTPLPKYVFVRDYDWQNPNMPLEAKALVDKEGMGELFFYGPGFTSTKEGERLAKIRAEALRCKGCVYQGSSSVPRLSPGYVFSLNKHFDPSCNGDYTLTHVHHEGSQEGYLSMVLGIALEHPSDQVYYRNTFTCIEKSVPFRAAHITERKKISGMIHAFVDKSSDGNAPEIDNDGRYKVVFPQDISGRSAGKASCWLRRAQPSVGMGYGTSFPLDAGVEVLISFTEGNPDRPFIASAIANRETGTVDSGGSALFSGLTTAGGGGLTFNDKGEKQGLNLTTGSGRSGLFMASGSLDSTIVGADSLSTVSTTTNLTLASLLNLFSSRVQTKVYVTGDPGPYDFIKMALKELTNISKKTTAMAGMCSSTASTASKDTTLSEEERLAAQDTAQNSKAAELSWSALTDVLTLLNVAVLQTQNATDIYHSTTNPSPYTSVLGTGGNNGALSLQTKLNTKLTSMIIAEAVASFTARALPVATAGLSNAIDAQDLLEDSPTKEASKDMDAAQQAIHDNYAAQRKTANEQYAAGNISEDARDAILTQYSEDNEKKAQKEQAEAVTDYRLKKANKVMGMVRNDTTALTTLLSEFMSYVLLMAKKDGIWRLRNATYGGVKIKSADANVAITSQLNTHISSNNSVSLVALGGMVGHVDDTAADVLSAQHNVMLDNGATQNYICSESENILNLAHKDWYAFAHEKATLHAADEVLVSNNAARANKGGIKELKAAAVAGVAAAGADREDYSSLEFKKDTCTLTNNGKTLLIEQNANPASGDLKVQRKEGSSLKNALFFTDKSSKLSYAEKGFLEIDADNIKIKHSADILLDADKKASIKANDVALDAKTSIDFSGNWGNIKADTASMEIKSNAGSLKLNSSGVITIG